MWGVHLPLLGFSRMMHRVGDGEGPWRARNIIPNSPAWVTASSVDVLCAYWLRDVTTEEGHG